MYTCLNGVKIVCMHFSMVCMRVRMCVRMLG